jgi:hypothetical protein
MRAFFIESGTKKRLVVKKLSRVNDTAKPVVRPTSDFEIWAEMVRRLT